MKKNETIKLAEDLQRNWIKIHNDWRTPVWGYFRDEAERISKLKTKSQLTDIWKKANKK